MNNQRLRFIGAKPRRRMMPDVGGFAKTRQGGPLRRRPTQSLRACRSLCHRYPGRLAEKSLGVARDRFCFFNRFLHYAPINRGFGRNDRDSFLQSKLRTQHSPQDALWQKLTFLCLLPSVFYIPCLVNIPHCHPERSRGVYYKQLAKRFLIK